VFSLVTRPQPRSLGLPNRAPGQPLPAKLHALSSSSFPLPPHEELSVHGSNAVCRPSQRSFPACQPARVIATLVGHGSAALTECPLALFPTNVKKTSIIATLLLSKSLFFIFLTSCSCFSSSSAVEGFGLCSPSQAHVAH